MMGCDLKEKGISTGTLDHPSGKQGSRGNPTKDHVRRGTLYRVHSSPRFPRRVRRDTSFLKDCTILRYHEGFIYC